jgi:DNA-binding NtrC family response regulator
MCNLSLRFCATGSSLYADWMDQTPPVVAVINSTEDIVDMLRIAIEQAGITVVTALTPEIRDGSVDLERFVQQHDPKVMLYDIAPPYEPNWRLFQHVTQMPALQGRQFVVTSTNAQHVEKLAGPQQHVYEIVGKPYDLGRIVQAVREALKVRPSR